MARGVPVACSDLPVLREVAGDQVEWLEPSDPTSIAAAVRRVVTDSSELERRRAEGRERAARFSWRDAATRTAAAYEEAIETRGRRG
jgi:glycosyltransferase involved in cell wall biosynthesis